MLILVTSKLDHKILKQAAQDLAGYIKFVVDINKNAMTVGGLRHFEGEQLLLQHGSSQADLWGGGLDLATGELDFDSMINIRPVQDNPSREVLNPDIRDQITQVVKKLIL